MVEKGLEEGALAHVHSVRHTAKMEGEGEVIPWHRQRRGVHECFVEVENQRVSRPRVGARRARTTATLAALATALAAALAAAAAAVVMLHAAACSW